jgi:hypothetical protein
MQVYIKYIQSHVILHQRVSVALVNLIRGFVTGIRQLFVYLLYSFVSPFNVQYLLVFLKSSGSCLHHHPRLPVTFIFPSIFPSITCFIRRFLYKMLPVQFIHMWAVRSSKLWNNLGR